MKDNCPRKDYFPIFFLRMSGIALQMRINVKLASIILHTNVYF